MTTRPTCNYHKCSISQLVPNMTCLLLTCFSLLFCFLVSGYHAQSIDVQTGLFGLSRYVPLPTEALVDVSSHLKLIDQTNRLKKRKRKLCKVTDGVIESLSDALYQSMAACKNLFKYERWNCSLDASKPHLMQNLFKETSFVQAIWSAGVVHTFARACSTGRMSIACTCDASHDLADNREAWIWGGCGDNYRYGASFTRKCVIPRSKSRSRRALSSDLLSVVSKHNANVGIMSVKEGLSEVCKCHGVSGSCTSKTCWQKLAPFTFSAESLKRKYDHAVKAEAPNHVSNTRRRRRNNNTRNRRLVRKHRKRKRGRQNQVINSANRRRWRRRRSRANVIFKPSKSLFYLVDSPNFCMNSNFSVGTSGRECEKDRNCETMCCGRGHNVQIKTVTSLCKCRVVWCCHVDCQKCVTKKEIYTCK